MGQAPKYSTDREDLELGLSDALVESADADEQSLAPFNIIRAETVVSKLPIHNLTKSENVDIHIAQRNERGKVELHWEVSHNAKYGQPRQLAYKLDTILINRKIDEIGRPVPKVLKLGSLNEMCKDLGSQKGELKRALQQNATTSINAKLSYQGADGSERHLEATFTRYSIVYTGERMPDGRKADAIYIIFNEPYWEVLNNAPMRPLDYDYLRELPPTSQRFYEILSYRFYAALKYDRERAKLLYSEYCTYAAQPRHAVYKLFKNQMYRVHQPHLQAEYIAKVEYQETADEEGNSDWIMFYTPGRKAKAEYATFNRRRLREGKPSSPDRPLRPMLESSSGIERRKDEVANPPLQLVRHFHQLARGKADYQPGAASKEIGQVELLLAAHSPEKIKFIVEFAVKEAQKTKFQMRTFGAIFQYVDEGGQVYEAWRGQQHQQAQLARVEAEQSQREIDEYQQAEAHLKNLSETEYEELYARVKQGLSDRHFAVISKFDAPTFDATIKAGMLRSILEGKPASAIAE